MGVEPYSRKGIAVTSKKVTPSKKVTYTNVANKRLCRNGRGFQKEKIGKATPATMTAALL